jgi:hypothetical protein
MDTLAGQCAADLKFLHRWLQVRNGNFKSKKRHWPEFQTRFQTPKSLEAMCALT